MNQKFIQLKELMPIIVEKLNNDGEVVFTPNGISMKPMLLGGRDVVTLTKVDKKLKKYDLPLYQRKDGKYILHRVVKVCKDGTYTMRGDNQIYNEKGITDDQIIAIVTKFVRNGKEYSVSNKKYRFYCSFWNFIRIFKLGFDLFKRLCRKVIRKLKNAD